MGQLAERSSRIEAIDKALAAAGHRMSAQRAEILKALVYAPSHPSAEDVYRSLKERFPRASLATVYKTLDALKEVGEIRLVSVAAGRAHYDVLNVSNHPHVICKICGRTEDVLVQARPSQLEAASKNSGYKVTEELQQFIGVCPDCLPTHDQQG